MTAWRYSNNTMSKKERPNYHHTSVLSREGFSINMTKKNQTREQRQETGKGWNRIK